MPTALGSPTLGNASQTPTAAQLDDLTGNPGLFSIFKRKRRLRRSSKSISCPWFCPNYFLFLSTFPTPGSKGTSQAASEEAARTATATGDVRQPASSSARSQRLRPSDIRPWGHPSACCGLTWTQEPPLRQEVQLLSTVGRTGKREETMD